MCVLCQYADVGDKNILPHCRTTGHCAGPEGRTGRIAQETGGRSLAFTLRVFLFNNTTQDSAYYTLFKQPLFTQSGPRHLKALELFALENVQSITF